MIFGPILPFELLISSRRPRYFVVRVLYGTVLLTTLWVHYAITIEIHQSPTTPQAVAALAAEFFRSLAIVQILAVLVLTPAMVAGTIAEEKDRRTIETREIVAGKLWGSLYSMRWLMLLVSILWLLGCAAGAFVPLIVPALVVELALISCFAVSLGLMFSLKLKSSLRAMAATSSVLFFFGGGYLFCCIPTVIGGSGSEVVMAGCIPFLLGFPLAADPDRSQVLSDVEYGFFAVWVIGTVGYFFASIYLLC